MRRIILVLIGILMIFTLGAQHKIRFNAGYQTSYTTVAEYLRPDNPVYRYDSVFLNPRTHAPTFSLMTDIDLNKGLYLSTGFGYSKKGIRTVTYPNYASSYYETWLASQHYLGLILQLRYQLKLGDKLGIFAAAGTRLDMPFGAPTNAARATGTSGEFVAPFGRIDNPDLSWTLHMGGSYLLGPGELVLELGYHHGFSNIIDDSYIRGRSASFLATLGYAIHLSRSE